MSVKSLVLRVGLRLLSATWRLRESVPAECRAILEGREPGVVAFWHGKMFPVWYRFRGGRCSAVVSASRDGELLADYLTTALGYHDVIRGSSSRGGGEALEGMVAQLASRSVLVTPDGPRGPAHHAKAGALVAALRAGRRVVSCSWRCRRSTRLKSWDAMELPWPFARVELRYCIFEPSPDPATHRIEEEELQRFEEVMDRLEQEGHSNVALR